MVSDHIVVEPEWRPNNRQRARDGKTGLYWCGRCDANHVSDGSKCEVCGARNGYLKRAKKPGPSG